MTASSTNKSMHNVSSSTVNKLSILVLKVFEISFMKNKNSIVEHGSPCFTPMSDSKKPDSFDWYLAHAFTALYILFSVLTSFDDTFSVTNFLNRCCRSILSKHFSKSTKAQNNFSY